MSVPPDQMNQVAAGVQQGILGGGAPAEPTPPPPAGIAAEGDQPTPEEIAMQEQLQDNISKIIDGDEGLEEGHKQVVSMLQQGKDRPAEALAHATLAVGESVFTHAQKAGIQLTDTQLVAAAMDTITDLSELAEAANFFQADDQQISDAFMLTLQGWMQAHPEMLDQEGIQQSLQEQQAMDQGGMPAQSGPAPAQPGPEAVPQQGGLIGAV